MNRSTAIGLACSILAMGLATPAPAAAQPRTGDVQQAMDALAKTPGVVGAIGEAYHDGRRIDGGTAGSRLIDGKGGRIPAGARYRAWSLTKQFTATVLLQLVKEGKLGVDDKLGAVLPVTAEQDLVERAGEITVRHLLQHTSGIPDYTGHPDLRPFDDLTTRYSPLDLVKMSRGRPRQQEPGERFSYSNTNYILLGAIIERLTGRTLAVEFQRRLLKPLRMSRSYLPVRPGQGIKGPHGHGYYPGPPDGTPRDVDRMNTTSLWAASGLISTSRDLATFYRALAQGRLLPAALREVMRYPVEEQPVCGGSISLYRGSGPGGLAMTFTSADGRLQFAVSATTSIAGQGRVRPALQKAAEAVLCPGT
ncbi:class A beta-lactamase-related serine hydrolase [Nonomuraea longispora]|uniref:Class A beta-lactamase-related serine hydrolase n=1 Tax=Nonomuraea longispora TaxID=1848320 RepID=A0A4R4MWG4_9ACTN|nr:serine hydrolase domain-containing protein [Nonomuraea longispora]TDC00538.1 class A beta-lactamase-related serine hydrolase [Nonomuraea longispora]